MPPTQRSRLSLALTLSALAASCGDGPRRRDYQPLEENAACRGSDAFGGEAGGARADAGAAGEGGLSAAPQAAPDEELVDLSGIALTEAEDLNADPRVVEVRLDAGPSTLDLGGKKTDVWSYNGTVPGPLIRAKRGDHLIVHFVNHLSEGTMIHWHGVRVPNAMDGTPMVQEPVLPGDSFDYEFDLPDPGLYWYHPHLDISQQVMRGLYGAILVDEPSEDRQLKARVLVLVLSDTSVDGNGALNFDTEDAQSLLNGREGNVLLVNGKTQPKLDVAVGEPLRLRVVNAAGARYFQLRIPGQSWKKLGADGGLAAEPRDADDVLVSNGERAELLLVPHGNVGDELMLQHVPYYRGAPLLSDEPVTLATLHLVTQATQPTPTLPATLRHIDPLAMQGATPVQIDITLEGTTFKVNGVIGSDAPHLMGHVGETQHWTVKNETALDHPFHVHGYFFQVVNPATGLPQQPLAWRDTVNIERNQQLELLISYDRPGMWMWHCHILDHPELGFMQMLHVMP